MAYYVVVIDGIKYGVNTETLEVIEIKEEKVVNLPREKEILKKAFDILRKEGKPI